MIFVDFHFFHVAGSSNQGNSPSMSISSSGQAPVLKTGVDDFLNFEDDKNDYEWYVILVAFSICFFLLDICLSGLL